MPALDSPAPGPDRSARAGRFPSLPSGTLLPCLLLLLITGALYGRSLWFDFVWDDVGYVQHNYAVQGLTLSHLATIWSRNFLGHYAPVHHTALMLLDSLSSGRPFGFHLGQLLIHCGCVLLVYILLRKLESGAVALLAAVLYAVHPSNVETVAWISETKSTLAFFFFLLSFLCFIRFRERDRWRDGLLCALFLALSALAKINTIVAPAIFLLDDYRREGTLRRSRLLSLGGYFLLSALFVVIHLEAFHGSAQNLEGSYYGGLGTHLMNLPLLISFYLRTTFFPRSLSAWEMFAVATHFNWLVALAWLGFLAMLTALGIAGWVYKNRSVVFWGLWFLIFLLPVLQIIPFPIWVADRYLYIPVVGALVLVSKAFFVIYDRATLSWQRWAAAAAILMALTSLSWKTWTYLPIWKNDLTLWEATTPSCLDSAYCHCNLGLALLRNGHGDQGIRELIRSVELRAAPDYLIHLGDAYTLTARDYRQAEVAYNLARQENGKSMDAEFYAKLARMYIKSGNLDAAKGAVTEGRGVNQLDPNLLTVNAFLQWKLGNLRAAGASVRQALIETAPREDPTAFLLPIWSDPAEVDQFVAVLRSSGSLQ